MEAFLHNIHFFYKHAEIKAICHMSVLQNTTIFEHE
jgi:hypothetical protein